MEPQSSLTIPVCSGGLSFCSCAPSRPCVLPEHSEQPAISCCVYFARRSEAEALANKTGLKFYRMCVKKGLNVGEGEFLGPFFYDVIR